MSAAPVDRSLCSLELVDRAAPCREGIGRRERGDYRALDGWWGGERDSQS